MTYGSETLITRLGPAGHRVVLQCENRLNCKVPKQSSDLVEELRLQEDLTIGDGNHLMSHCRITKQSSAQQLSPSISYVTSKTPRSDQIEPCRIRGDVGTDIAGLGLDDRQGSERAATVRGLAEIRKQSSSKSSHRNWPRSSCHMRLDPATLSKLGRGVNRHALAARRFCARLSSKPCPVEEANWDGCSRPLGLQPSRRGLRTWCRMSGGCDDVARRSSLAADPPQSGLPTLPRPEVELLAR